MKTRNQLAREAAKAAGERFYETSKPCRNGHLSKRYTATGQCARCAVEAQQRYMPKKPWHPERITAKQAGRTRYSTGEPCENGHLSERLVCDGQCVACKVSTRKRWLRHRPGLEAHWAREHRAKNPGPHRASSQKWQRNNRERAAAKRRLWHETKGSLYHRARSKRWRDANIETVRAYNAAKMRIRRGLRGENGGSYTLQDIAALRTKQENCCAACGRDDLKLEVDHIVPITKGGTNDPTNLQLLCGRCNKSKGNRDLEEWLSNTRLLLPS